MQLVNMIIQVILLLIEKFLNEVMAVLHVPSQPASDFRSLSDEHEDHPVLLNETVTVGYSQNARVGELLDDWRKIALLRRTDEEHVASPLCLLSGLKIFNDKSPALHGFAFEIVLQRLSKGVLSQNTEDKFLIVAGEDVFGPDGVLRHIVQKLNLGEVWIDSRLAGAGKPAQKYAQGHQSQGITRRRSHGG